MSVSQSLSSASLFAASLAAAALGLALAVAAAASAAEADFDVLDAVNGVWAYHPDDVASPGDFTCDDRPMAIMVTDGGDRLASKRPGDEAERYGLILDVRNDFPLGPALSVVWEDAPEDDDGAPVATVLVMPDEDSFAMIGGDSLRGHLSGARGLEQSPRRARCGAE
jgi:hypothetical protein